MTTYNTYEEAKIANPESEIYWYLDGALTTVFTSSKYRTGGENNLANPADHSAKALEEKPEQVDWKSGDHCIYTYQDGTKCGALVIGPHPDQPVFIIETYDNYLQTATLEDLSKPETPEQKKERESDEAMGRLMWMHKKAYGMGGEIEVDALILKAGYRKPE